MSKIKLVSRFAVASMISFAAVLSAQHAMASVEDGLSALDTGDYETAAQLFAQEVDDGNLEAAFYLGRMLELGLGTEANLADAVPLYQQAADGGNAAAKNRLGILYLEGQAPLIQDFVEGTRLVCEAAEAEDINGKLNCGLAQIEGRGVETNPEAGAALISEAAEANNVAAINVLAELHSDGVGVERDQARAVELFERSATIGNPVGLFSLGQAFALGSGKERDLVQAHAYFNLAASRGHPEGPSARDAVAEQLTSEQLANAQKVAREWKPSPIEGDATEQ